MAEIKLYDYYKTIEDDWWGSYQEFYCIGQGDLSSAVIVPLIEAVPDGEEILVKINSCGGLVFEGWAIYNALKAHKGKVVVRIDGIAASIASIIAMAGEEVVMCAAALLMIHKPTIDAFWYGQMDAEDLKREAAALDQIQAVLNSIYFAKTNLDAATIDSMINAETWITPAQAITLGFADSISQTITEQLPSLAQNTFNHVFKNADPATRAYANRTIKINKNMTTKEALQKAKNSETEGKGLWTAIKSYFKNELAEEDETPAVENASSELKAGGNIYYSGVLGVGTEVFTDEAMTTHPAEGSHDLADGNYIKVGADGIVTEMEKSEDPATDEATNAALQQEIVDLKADNAALVTAVDNLSTQLTANNELLTALRNIKSKYVAPEREDNPAKKPENRTEEKPTIDKDEVKKRREELKNKKLNK